MSDKDRAVGTAIPADFTDPAELHDILINRIKQYHAVSGIDIIEKALLPPDDSGGSFFDFL